MMDALGRQLPGVVETVVRDEFGVIGYNLHLNCFLTPIPVYGWRIADRNNFSTGQTGQIGSIYPICPVCPVENKITATSVTIAMAVC
jgi:hypothetical protein